MRLTLRSVSVTRLALGLLCSTLAGCDEESEPRYVGLDSGPAIESDSGATATPDAAVLDAGSMADSGSSAADAASPLRDGGAHRCSEPRIVSLGFDPSVASAPRVAAGLDGDTMQVIFSDSASGVRRLMRARVSADGSDDSVTALAGLPEGAVSPSLSALESGGWLLSYSSSGNSVAAARLDSSFALLGTPSQVTATGSEPHLAALGDGGWVVWNQDGTLWGRPVDAMGATTADRVSLLSLAAAETPTALSTFGDESSLLVAFGGTSGALGRATGRRLGPNGPVSEPFEIGGSDNASGAIALARRTETAPPGAEPLQGASVFGVLVARTNFVRFVLLDVRDGVPGLGSNEATISERDEFAWGASVAPFENGYVIAYRSRPAAGGPSRVRLAFMSRDSCRLGVVDARFTIAATESLEGSPTELLVSDSQLYVAWGERLVDATEYRAVATRCQ